MKRKDLILIIVIVFFSSIVSLLITKAIFGGAKAIQSTEVVEPISAQFEQPNTKYFNASSFDPTLLIKVETSNVTDPFAGSETH